LIVYDKAAEGKVHFAMPACRRWLAKIVWPAGLREMTQGSNLVA
jgi:hypothetical protein